MDTENIKLGVVYPQTLHTHRKVISLLRSLFLKTEIKKKKSRGMSEQNSNTTALVELHLNIPIYRIRNNS